MQLERVIAVHEYHVSSALAVLPHSCNPCLASKLQADRHCFVPSAQIWLVVVIWLEET